MTKISKLEIHRLNYFFGSTGKRQIKKIIEA